MKSTTVIDSGKKILKSANIIAEINYDKIVYYIFKDNEGIRIQN